MKKQTQGFSLKSVTIIIVITALVTSLTTGLIIYNLDKSEIQREYYGCMML